ncbi:hypothetical protein T4D_3166 [Trichinella pseudospiralis]|uniref:Uncharacterized protein n=1 Tax=Trichinella pseudospiralis TaxID=6337 RepID=A0A0V1FXD1_TRIPS|nr:hypothetical protein T4D_3166 [Trichinella pseudospiralis]
MASSWQRLHDHRRKTEKFPAYKFVWILSSMRITQSFEKSRWEFLHC